MSFTSEADFLKVALSVPGGEVVAATLRVSVQLEALHGGVVEREGGTVRP